MTTQPRMTYIKNEAGLFVCPECGETKNRSNTMYYHIKKHNGLLDHACPEIGCDKRFVHKGGLAQHMAQAHATTEPDLACPCCDHSCRTKANLLIHVARKHGEGWVPVRDNAGDCVGCQKHFASDTAYFYHAVQCFGSTMPLIVREVLNAEESKKC
jgi:hypothetical protein